MTELQALRKELEAAVKPGHGEAVGRLLDLLEKQLRRCDLLEKEDQRLKQRIAELENRDPPSEMPGCANAQTRPECPLTGILSPLLSRTCGGLVEPAIGGPKRPLRSRLVNEPTAREQLRYLERIACGTCVFQ